MKFMKKKLTTALFCICTLFATPLFASNDSIIFIDFDLPAKEPQNLSNVFRWTINAECTIIKSDETSVILFKMLRKNGVLNDIIFHRGESLRIAVKLQEKFTIVAEPGSTVQMTNEGETLVTFRCSATTDPRIPGFNTRK
jgi:hypothetical protein